MNAVKAGMRPSEAVLGYYRHTYAWVVANPRTLRRPVPYTHPSGAIVWVSLEDRVRRKILRQLAPRKTW
jgi:hypothetical protein